MPKLPPGWVWYKHPRWLEPRPIKWYGRKWAEIKAEIEGML